jgi:hypothetical protein
MIPVFPHWNDQAILYALGFWNTIARELFAGLDPADVEIAIVIEQPRAPGGGGVWITSMAALLKEGKKIRADAEATRDENAERTAGPKQCQFCKAARAGTCPEYAAMQLDAFDLGLEELDDYVDLDVPPPMPKVVTPERRSYILKFAPVFSRFVADLHAQAYDDARKGRLVPGMKLVPGRTPARKWKDDEKEKAVLEVLFGDAAYNRKLLSPTQVEERIGKKEFSARFKHHLRREEAKPILVPSTDRREPLASLQTVFDSLMDEDDLV